ncbi:MAG: 3-oxoacyl-[acyl-carrier-protein] reductase [Peptostreptococcaceae bacterium]|nr:3-oxoacyl-[acyl-carrier-protein] reductase [Peptostreptococcaceae bacterium]
MEKTAVITGSARGIGRQTALELSKAGYHILLNYRREPEDIEQLEEEIRGNGVRVLRFAGDISDFETGKSMIEKAMELSGSIDVLVNNAGITRDKLLVKMSEEDFDQVIAVNLKGTFNGIRHAARTMMKQRSGRIINISSVAGLIGNIGQANYAASKAGVIGLTRTAAKELAPYGITVNAIAPGFIETAMTQALPDNIQESILSSAPMKRAGKVEDVASLVRFLASEEASYITGQVIKVDGGMVMS